MTERNLYYVVFIYKNEIKISLKKERLLFIDTDKFDVCN